MMFCLSAHVPHGKIITYLAGILHGCVTKKEKNLFILDHPLYQVALKELGRVKTSDTKGIEFKVKVADLEMKAVPKSGEAKYSRLLAECKLLAEEAKHSDEGWRKVFATVIKIRRTLQNNPDGNFVQLQRVSDDTVVTFETPRKRQRTTQTT
eukprot:snap_masked-scaffold_28-processed-gene-4.64-mRNA-1 protein AED:1.00 eAED:1.00 QI:0/0/0/0/1/1/2/0/151